MIRCGKAIILRTPRSIPCGIVWSRRSSAEPHELSSRHLARSTDPRRFPGYPGKAIELIPNGFDEETFRRAGEGAGSRATVAQQGPIKLLHSGIVYRSERDPKCLFAAIAALKRKGAITANSLQLVLRASGDEAGFRNDVQRACIDDIVRLEPGVDYLAALQEMMSVDGLLILQASNCNAQVPAKLYRTCGPGGLSWHSPTPSGIRREPWNRQAPAFLRRWIRRMKSSAPCSSSWRRRAAETGVGHRRTGSQVTPGSRRLASWRACSTASRTPAPRAPGATGTTAGWR